MGRLSSWKESRESKMNWTEYYIKLAQQVSLKSKDRSVKVGAIVVGPDHEIRSTGYNGFPRGVDETKLSRWERPLKYDYVEHAERNAIYNAVRVGISLKDCTAYMYSTIPGGPCTSCAKGLMQSGIKEIVVLQMHSNSEFDNKCKDQKNRADWKTDIDFAASLLAEAGVVLRAINN